VSGERGPKSRKRKDDIVLNKERVKERAQREQTETISFPAATSRARSEARS
jgi:hypothetical protein